MKKILVAALAIITLLALPALAQHRDADVVDLRILRSTWGYVTVETAEEFDYNSTALTLDHNSTSGTTYGIWATTPSTGGTAVYGLAEATTGTTYGLHGATASITGNGVYGEAYDTSGNSTAAGVHGKTAGLYGYGVFGENSATDGVGYGVYGVVAVDSSAGVWGENQATSGNAVGVWGLSGPGVGCLGQASDSAGTGVYALATSTVGTEPALLAQHNGDGEAVRAAGPITCTAQCYDFLTPVDVVNGAKKIDTTNGIFVDNTDDAPFYVQFDIPLPSILYGAMCHIDSIKLRLRAAAGTDTILDLKAYADSLNCDALQVADLDTLEDFTDCTLYSLFSDRDVSGSSIFVMLDGSDNVNAGDIIVEGAPCWYRFNEMAASIP